MFYLLNYNIVDSKKDVWFNGSLLDKNKKPVEEMFLFSSGSPLAPKDVPAPFTIKLDAKQSGLGKRTLKDKVSTSLKSMAVPMVVSPAAVAVFEKSKIAAVQYFDVGVQGADLQVSGYKIVHIAEKIDCVNVAKSDIEIENDKIRSITSLVLDEKKIPAATQIFLLGKKKTAIILVRDTLRKSIEAAGLTGFQFVDLAQAGTLY